MRTWFDEVEEQTISALVSPSGFVARETPGRRMLNKTNLIPALYLSRAGKNRRKANKFHNRKRALVRMTDLV